MTTPQFRHPVAQDAERCYAIEIGAYEGDEAATLEKIRTRIEQYPAGFVILEVAGQIVGFINSGCAHQVVMADEAFKELVGHDPLAANVVIMSVVVDPAYQGKGYSKLLMAQFIGQMKGLGKQTIHLMCKQQHVDLYRKMGFAYVRPSPSEHGGMAWHDMLMTL
ncbi:GNAT family N-acetyltransferase [Pseudomonas putida]